MGFRFAGNPSSKLRALTPFLPLQQIFSTQREKHRVFRGGDVGMAEMVESRESSRRFARGESLEWEVSGRTKGAN